MSSHWELYVLIHSQAISIAVNAINIRENIFLGTLGILILWRGEGVGVDLGEMCNPNNILHSGQYQHQKWASCRSIDFQKLFLDSSQTFNSIFLLQ